MGVSKVTYAAKVLIDLTSDTVVAAALKRGTTAHDAAGNVVTGTMDGMIFMSGDYIAVPTPLASVTADGFISLASGHGRMRSDGYFEVIQ